MPQDRQRTVHCCGGLSDERRVVSYIKRYETQNPTPKGGIFASKGLVLPLKTPFLGLFGGTFTGFYKNTKSYIIEY